MSNNLVIEEFGYYAKFHGVTSLEEMIHVNGKIIGESNFRKAKYMLVDFSGITELVHNVYQLKVLAQMDITSHKWNKDLILVLVLNELKEIQKLFSEYVQMSEQSNWEIVVFDEILEAREFVDKLR